MQIPIKPPSKPFVFREDLVSFLADLLNISSFEDYCPNGLQVQGSPFISNIVTGVTASRALIEAAIDKKADTILVHHGIFWKGDDPCIVGMKRERIQLLLKHNINLFAYHLPLDAHPELGNNALLAEILGLNTTKRFGPQQLGCLGVFNDRGSIITVADFAKHIEKRLGKKITVVGDQYIPINSIAWCSGAAQRMLIDAANAGADVFISGELSEQTMHEAYENDIAYIACGHHATERFGVCVLGDFLSREFEISHTFIDIDNPA